MQFIRSRIVPLLLAALTVLALASMSACGDRGTRTNKEASKGTPVPDTPREHSGAGTPLLLFGGGNRSRPGEHDADFQEYLIWKEWQQYIKYKTWVEEQRQNPPPENAETE